MNATTGQVLEMLMTEEQPKKNNMKEKEDIDENIAKEELESATGGTEETDWERQRRERLERPGKLKRIRAFPRLY